MLGFLKKSQVSKKIVVIFTFSRLPIAKWRNVNQQMISLLVVKTNGHDRILFSNSIVTFFWVSMLALLGVLTPVKYSLFFAIISLSSVYFGLSTFGTCCLALVDVSKPKKYHTSGRKGSKKRKAFSMIQKSLLSKFF